MFRQLTFWKFSSNCAGFRIRPIRKRQICAVKRRAWHFEQKEKKTYHKESLWEDWCCPEMETRDLAPKAQVLRCRQSSPYTAASRGVAHYGGQHISGGALQGGVKQRSHCSQNHWSSYTTSVSLQQEMCRLQKLGAALFRSWAKCKP